MPLQVKEGYINPLTMMGQKKNGLTAKAGPGQPLQTQQQDKDAKAVQTLQGKQQALQNQLLLMKGTTDAGGSKEAQDALAEQLKEIASELKTAKAQEAKNSDSSLSVSKSKSNYDTFEKTVEKPKYDSIGVYSMEKGDNGDYKIKFDSNQQTTIEDVKSVRT